LSSDPIGTGRRRPFITSTTHPAGARLRYRGYADALAA
jgi:hypothetical protein